MLQLTSSRDTTPARKAKITILHVLSRGEGSAFAVTEDTDEKVFIPAVMSSRLGLRTGQTWDASVRPNLLRPDKTELFACHSFAQSCVDAGSDDLGPVVLEVLKENGGAWLADEMAEWCGCAERDAMRALETLYQRKQGVAKVILFTSPDAPGQRVWYTAVPERIDVDEFEDEGAVA
jgi:hypothetical protein